MTMMQNDLFQNITPKMEMIDEGVTLFRNYVDSEVFYNHIMKMSKIAPFRHMITPGGKRINVSITNAGDVGWYSDRKGYRYSKIDPLSGNSWPALPQIFIKTACAVATKSGFDNYMPDSCLINCYEPAVRLTPHQDQDEKDFNQPIVSLSIGVSAIFQLYGNKRGGTPKNIILNDGDILVFGGPARRYFHGVKKLDLDSHPLTGSKRYNLTFRKAL